jgi:hypothetical protein
MCCRPAPKRRRGRSSIGCWCCLQLNSGGVVVIGPNYKIAVCDWWMWTTQSHKRDQITVAFDIFGPALQHECRRGGEEGASLLSYGEYIAFMRCSADADEWLWGSSNDERRQDRDPHLWCWPLEKGAQSLFGTLLTQAVEKTKHLNIYRLLDGRRRGRSVHSCCCLVPSPLANDSRMTTTSDIYFIRSVRSFLRPRSNSRQLTSSSRSGSAA